VLGRAKELAGELGGQAIAVVAGQDVADVAGTVATYGPAQVLVADDARFAHPVAGSLVDVLEAAVEAAGGGYVLASASVLAADVGGALAARLGAGINTDSTNIVVESGALVSIRPSLDDSVYVRCGWTGGEKAAGIALFRAGSFKPQSPNGASGEVVALTVAPSDRRVPTYGGVEAADTGGVDITEADVLIGAGRGFGGPDKFSVAETLASSLGGEVATTRAVVDAGWYDYATQVGQTGKTVAPKLYIALGISGAIQHKVGMQNSGTVIAINKDPNAPIFEYADFGVVGDLFDVAPKLEAKIREKKGS
jgi:electron transfer flavoprotein alpha subunit